MPKNDNSAIAIHFVPEGGFGKAGGFVEVAFNSLPSGKETIYQRQAHLTVELLSGQVEVVTTIQNSPKSEASESSKYSCRRSLLCKATIVQSRWGHFKLSHLGSPKLHNTISLSIHETDSEGTWAGGLEAADDLDFNRDEEFYLEVRVLKPRFDQIISELMLPNTELRAFANFGAFNGFLAEWSPSISDGRVIKFLGNQRVVKNMNEVPIDFFSHQSGLEFSDIGGTVTIRASRKITDLKPSILYENADQNDLLLEKSSNRLPLGSLQSGPAGNLFPTLEKLLRRICFGIFLVAFAVILVAVT